jgi:polysaccharide deacetylase 2 family uncharacterized protein YibQ
MTMVDEVDDVAKTVSEFMKGYKEQHADNKEGAPKVLFVIDSLGSGKNTDQEILEIDF